MHRAEPGRRREAKDACGHPDQKTNQHSREEEITKQACVYVKYLFVCILGQEQVDGHQGEELVVLLDLQVAVSLTLQSRSCSRLPDRSTYYADKRQDAARAREENRVCA